MCRITAWRCFVNRDMTLARLACICIAGLIGGFALALAPADSTRTAAQGPPPLPANCETYFTYTTALQDPLNIPPNFYYARLVYQSSSEGDCANYRVYIDVTLSAGSFGPGDEYIIVDRTTNHNLATGNLAWFSLTGSEVDTLSYSAVVPPRRMGPAQGAPSRIIEAGRSYAACA